MADERALALAVDMMELGKRVAQQKGAPDVAAPVLLLCAAFAAARSTAPEATADLLLALADLRPDAVWSDDPHAQDALIAWARETAAFDRRHHG